MTKEEKQTAVRKAIIAAYINIVKELPLRNPELMETNVLIEFNVKKRELPLELILQAIGQTSNALLYDLNMFGQFFLDGRIVANYDLTKPFSAQSQKLYDFLYDLICKKDE